MQEQGGRTVTGLDDMHAMAVACLDVAAPHGQRVQQLLLRRHDVIRMNGACRPVNRWALARIHESTLTGAFRGPTVRISNQQGAQGWRDDLVVSSHGSEDYCAFTKALEHLADRWSLLIVAELIESSPRGFNALAAGVPGRISRSVLAERLRRLESLGIVARDDVDSRSGDYRLTAVGRGLTPTLLSLREWAGTWLPDDPAAAERDPDLILAWLTRRIDETFLPERQTVIEFRTHYTRPLQCWLVVQRDREPYGCFQDPLLDESRYVYVTVAMSVLLALAHGTRSWREALAEGSIAVSGDPDLLRRLSDWFR
jgi:DNA-binding HxlR family transcriptional regulator